METRSVPIIFHCRFDEVVGSAEIDTNEDIYSYRIFPNREKDFFDEESKLNDELYEFSLLKVDDRIVVITILPKPAIKQPLELDGSVSIHLQIEAVYTLDGGYYRNDNMAKIEELVQNEIRALTVLIKAGATSPKPVRANIKLKRVIYEKK